MNSTSKMTVGARCETCGAAVPPDAPLGQCPVCLLEFPAEEPAPDEPAAAGFELPRLFGEYELLRLVGCGGMGLVYEARQTTLKRRVALKMIRPELASKKFLRRFLVEGEAAARLHHPNIIPIHEIRENGEESFFTMQFIEGDTLKEKIRRRQLGLGPAEGPRSTDETRARQRVIARLIATLARAVAHAHERGVFHRDLKPGNIIVDAAGEPHIADFGVAKIIADEHRLEPESTLTVPGATLGTPEYMAPEQASGSSPGAVPKLAAADLYSLGAILYELLTGRPPFRGHSNLETLQKVRTGDVRRPRALDSAIARDLETICLKCLEKNPQARYASAGALAEDLQRWLDGQSIRARPAGLPLRLQRWIKRNPAGAALIFSLFFGLGVSLCFVAVLFDRMRADEINEALEREAYLQKINDWWALPAITNLVISSSLLAELRDATIRPFVEGRDLRLRFAMSVDQNPITRAYSVASVLGELERRMGEHLRRNVFIDLHISKTTHLEAQHLAIGEADVQRLDALSYLQAKAREPGLLPVLVENDADEIVFCVSRDSGITNLVQLAGKSVGLGDSNSAVTVMAQYSLLTNGLRKTDLRSIEHFMSASIVATANLPELGSAEIITDMRELKSGREALRHLLEGEVDAAVTPKRYYEMRRHRGAGLRMIGRFPGVPEVFAVRAGLDPEVVEAFRAAMLSLERQPGLGTLSSFRIVTGVFATNDSYFDSLRRALTRVEQQFHSREASPAPDHEPAAQGAQ